MKTGMRHVMGGVALAAVYLLQATPAFAQLPRGLSNSSSAGTIRRSVRRLHLRSSSAVRRGAPAQPQPQQQQAPQQQAQPKPKPEPVPQNTQERAACLNKDTPAAALIAACTVIIDANRDKPSVMATAYFHRGDALREKGDHDAAIKDLSEAITLDGKSAAYFARATSYKAKGDLDNAIADLDQAIKFDSKNPTYYSTRSHALYEKRDYDARRRRPHRSDPAQSEEHADDLQPRHDLPRQGRARPRGAGFRSRHQGHAERRVRLSQPRSRLSRHARLRPRDPRFRRGDQDQRQASARRSTIAASPMFRRARPIRRSRISIWRSRSTRRIRSPSTTAASPIVTRARPTARSTTTTRRSWSALTSRSPTTTAATPTTTSATTTAPSRTTTRRSRSTRTTRSPITTAASSITTATTTRRRWPT